MHITLCFHVSISRFVYWHKAYAFVCLHMHMYAHTNLTIRKYDIQVFVYTFMSCAISTYVCKIMSINILKIMHVRVYVCMLCRCTQPRINTHVWIHCFMCLVAHLWIHSLFVHGYHVYCVHKFKHVCIYTQGLHSAKKHKCNT